MPSDLFDQSGDDAVVLRLHVQPGAGRTAVVGRHGDALKVRVAAPPEGGRANEAVLKLVAELLGAEKDAVTLVGGPSSRSKRVQVSGVEPEEAAKRIADAVAGASERPSTKATGRESGGPRIR